MTLAAPVEDRPWARLVHHAEVRLRAPTWPRCLTGTQLRGAVVEALDKTLSGRSAPSWETGTARGLSVAWHGHSDQGTAQRPPEVLYRTDGGPRLYFLGHHAHDHVRLLGQQLHAVRTPNGRVVPVEGLEVAAATTEVQLLTKTWRTYELVTPLFPSDAAYYRRPQQPGMERVAWLGGVLQGTILHGLSHLGLETRRPLHVLVHPDETYQDELRCEWRRKDGRLHKAVGFRCRFTANVVLPDGWGLGKHRSEGWGEVRAA